MKLRIGMALAVLLAAGLAAVWMVGHQRPHYAKGPMEVSLWYWNTPFQISHADIKQLRSMGVRRLFVRAGTFTNNGHEIFPIVPQQWQRTPGAPPVILVFNCDWGVLLHFGKLSVSGMAASILAAVRTCVPQARAAGLHVEGVQLDFDCPTRLLPRYADLLRRVREGLAASLSLSITALPTWLPSRGVRDVARQVDFMIPQFYENQIGRTIENAGPVQNMAGMKDGVRLANRLGCPFYAGVPAYGHALIYDEHGQLAGIYHGMDAEDASRLPAFHLLDAYPSGAEGRHATRKTWVGEELVRFRAIRPGLNGRGLGYTIVYTLPEPEMVRRQAQWLRTHRPTHCRGIVLYRFPQAGDIESLTLPAIASALKGTDAMPRFKVSVKVQPTPWAIVDTGRRGRMQADVWITLRNTGEAGTFLSPDAVTLTVQLNRPGADSVAGEFDSVAGFSPGGLRSSPERASVLRFTRAHMASRETAIAGPIHIGPRGATAMQVQWCARLPGGFRTIGGEAHTIKVSGLSRKP